MVWENVKESCFTIWHILATWILCISVDCSLYAPEIYAMDSVSGGVPDTEYSIFLLTLVLRIAQLTAYAKQHFYKIAGAEKKRKLAVFFRLLAERIRLLTADRDEKDTVIAIPREEYYQKYGIPKFE